ncbi:MAG: DUF433 domain-containing protein [Acidobacteriia bacterium]|nr:DUF433 domain-containing protein [Terriglobia bacterium]
MICRTLLRAKGNGPWRGLTLSKACFGNPCVRGTRIRVSLLLDFLASGAAIEEILENYPQRKREDILAAIADGAEMSRERYVDLPGSFAV